MSISTGSTSVDVEDATLRSTLGAQKFKRFYEGSDSTWRYGFSLGTPTSAYLPLPFGTSPTFNNSLRWWHSFFSFVYPQPSNWTVRLPAGSTLDYAPCANSSCYAALQPQSREATERLRYDAPDGGTFTVLNADHRYVYASKWTAPDGGEARYFLTRIEDAESSAQRPLATLIYATPDAGACPGASNGVPYLAAVRSAEGAQLEFDYVALGGYAGAKKVPQECVISSVWLRGNGDGMRTRLASYTYSLGLSGLLSKATLNTRLVSDGGTLAYAYAYPTYSVNRFTVYEDGALAVRHIGSDAGVAGLSLEALNNGTSLTQEWTRGTSAGIGCPPLTSCLSAVAQPLAKTLVTSGTGAGATSAFGSSVTVVSTSFAKEGRVQAWADDAGTIEYAWADLDGGRVVHQGEKDRRGNWTTWAVTTSTASFPDAGFTRPAEYVTRFLGASNAAGANALQRTDYTYQYGAAYEQQVATESQPSVVPGGTTAVTTKRYDPATNRLKAVIRQGTTRVFSAGSWVQQQRFVGTFYLTQRTCPASAADPFDRVLEVHGPCLVSSASATDCDVDALAVPITQFEYYPDNDTTNDRNRLKKTTRYPQASRSGTLSCGSVALTQDWLVYDAFGNPTSTRDENGVTTSLTYQGELLASRSMTVSGQTSIWTYRWDNGKLTSIGMPEGNFEVFCYRNTANNGPCSPTGAWTGKLQWRAKCDTATCANYSERVAYQYWNDGSLKRETYMLTGAVVRKVVQHERDVRGRETWSAVGDTVRVEKVSGYDRADNLVAVGIPYNGTAAAACGTPLNGDSPTDTKCSKLQWDAADRLAALTRYPTPSTGTTTCMAYDAQGNPSAVATDYPARTSPAQPASCTQSSCNPNVGAWTADCLAAAIRYQHDDFGNLIEVATPWSSNTSATVTHFAYDGQGNQTVKQTAAMAAQTFPARLEFQFDALSRLTRAQQFGEFTIELYRMVYDVPTLSGSLNLAGRLAQRVDSFGDTNYSYDEAGHFLSERRARFGTYTPGDGYLSPDTTYVWSRNGNLLTLTYPHGRVVNYVYGTGALKDRVASVTVVPFPVATATNLVTNVSWEPYGALRAYRTATTTAANVEYWQTDASEVAPTASCTASIGGTANQDKTGRPRAVFASTGSFSLGAGSGDVVRQVYTWSKDALVQVDSCVLGAGLKTQTFGYDGASRLTSVTGGPATETGRSYARAYQYDARDNRTKTSIDVQSDGGTACTVDHLALGGANQVDSPWLDGNATCGDNNPRNYSPDQDGRVGTLTNGFGAWQLDFVYTSASGQAGLDSVFKQVRIRQCSTCAAATWTYYYDAFNRRRYKQSPVGGAQEFFYDNQQTLLTDRVGDVDGPSPSYLVVDDYVWLGGRAVAMLRGKMTTGYVRQADNSAACNRMGTSSPCGTYHMVTDWQGKPIATLDNTGKVAGYVEYEPHGFTNRAYVAKTVVGPTAPPYNTVFPVVTTTTVGASTAISAVKSEVVSARALLFNTDLALVNCPNPGQVIVNGTTALTQAGFPLKWAWTNWVQLTPTTPTTAPGGQPATVTAKGDCSTSPTVTPYYVEFRRAQKGAPHVFVPLRAPGQYFDEETDLFENWNRYYDPFKGVYLQPEPLLQAPNFVRTQAASGTSLPVYSYAGSNPVRNVDPDGRCFFAGVDTLACLEAAAAAAALAVAVCQATNTCPWHRIPVVTPPQSPPRRPSSSSTNSHADSSEPSADPIPFPGYIEADRPCGLAALRLYNDCIASGRGHADCGARATVCWDACTGGAGTSAAACQADFEANACSP